jgi:hypothetical protein
MYWGNLFMDDFKKEGYWSIATQKHLKSFVVDSPNLDEFDSLNLSGKSGRLLGIVRGNRQIENIKKLEKMAASVGIGKTELHTIILPKLEVASDKQIEIKKNTAGDITGIEEYLFSNGEVLSITGKLFNYLNPSEVEKIVVESLDVTKKIPQLEGELLHSLSQKGFHEKNIKLSCTLQEQFRLIQKLGQGKGKEPIYSNEYVWGPNHKKIAFAIGNLDVGKKQTMKEVIELIQNNQGYPLDNLTNVDKDLLFLAKKTGIINPTLISSNRGIKKEFGFSSNLFQESIYMDDILDDVKLLLASIRFGEHYTEHSTLTQPIRFLSALINRDKVGPHSANATDFVLLEKRGIVKTEHAFGDRYFLKLIRKDVGEAALKILTDGQFDLSLNIDSKEVNSDAIMQYGSFQSPEEYRMQLAKSPENISEAEDYLARVIRDETL